MLVLYGGSLVLKNKEIEAAKNTYIPTTYDIQKKDGRPITVDQVQRGKFQEFITISGDIVNGELKSEVAPFVRRQIRQGAEAHLHLNESGKVLRGKVTSVANGPSLLTGLYQVIVNFRQTLPKHMEGMTVDIPVKEVSNVLILPREAVSQRETKPLVYVVKDNKLIKKTVEIAGANALVYWIKSGLSQGETVVTSDTRYFTGGELVQIVKDTRKDL